MRTRDVRRSGSAALDLAAVASGAIDVFFEYCLFPWDHAAGTLLIREAGGTIIQIDGSPVSFEAPCGVIAGNPDICREVLDLSAELFEI
jgi:myo-inositol-1(or 4)-monophosphatase